MTMSIDWENAFDKIQLWFKKSLLQIDEEHLQKSYGLIQHNIEKLGALLLSSSISHGDPLSSIF